MKKFKLNLDDLHVQSFDTTPAWGTGARGTVYGHASDTCMTVCLGLCRGKIGTDISLNLAECPSDVTCATCETCYASCNGSCDAQCGTAMNTCAGFGDTCDCSCIATAVFCG